MSTVATVPLNNRTGSITTPSANIPDAVSRGEIVITGASVNDTTVRLSASIDFSNDGGVTWASTSPGPDKNPFPVIVTCEGGPTTPKGQPLTQFDISAPFPPGTNRKVRGTFIFDGNPFTGSAAINLT